MESRLANSNSLIFAAGFFSAEVSLAFAGAFFGAAFFAAGFLAAAFFFLLVRLPSITKLIR